MIRLIYEPPKGTFANYEDPSPVKGITMELRDDVSWEEATTEFHNFLRGAGYVIPYDFEDNDNGFYSHPVMGNYKEVMSDKPKREWVGLTEEEFVEISREYTESFNSGSPDWFDVIKYTGAVEAKLKEKNT